MSFLGHFVKHDVQYVVKSGSSVFSSCSTIREAEAQVKELQAQDYLDAHWEERQIGEPLVDRDED